MGPTSVKGIKVDALRAGRCHYLQNADFLAAGLVPGNCVNSQQSGVF